MTDTRPSITEALDAFGLDATVTPPGGDPVEIRAFWLGDSAFQVPPGADLRRTERHRALVLPLAGLLGSGDAFTLPACPRETVINIPEYEGGDPVDFQIDSVLREDFDCRRVLVVPA